MSNDPSVVDSSWDAATPASGTHSVGAPPAPKPKQVLATDERNLKVVIKDGTFRLLRSRAALDDVVLSVAAEAALGRGLAAPTAALTPEEMLLKSTQALNRNLFDRLNSLRMSRHSTWSVMVPQLLEAAINSIEDEATGGSKAPPPPARKVATPPVAVSTRTTVPNGLVWEK